ncbi:MAG: hypothetical protein Q8P20_10905 [bacterium]|nr:hypothetical protein [bacterium]
MNKIEKFLEHFLDIEYHFLRYQNKYILFGMNGGAVLLNRQAATLIQLMLKEKSVHFIPESMLHILAKTFEVSEEEVESNGSINTNTNTEVDDEEEDINNENSNTAGDNS